MTDDLDESLDVDGEEIGFTPAVPNTGSQRKRRRGVIGSALRRRLSSGVVLLAALTATGGLYAAFATSSGANGAAASAEDIAQGRQLYSVSCITCHGGNLQGVTSRGPSLIGVGAASVYFQVSTGRMPVAQQQAVAPRKPPMFTEEQIRQIAAYVQSIGGGPAIPEGDLRDGNLAEGGEQFRLNCSSCHGTSGQGAPLSAGKVAPSMLQATDLQIYTAMLTGPENMPVFSDGQLTPERKKSIIRYVQTLKASSNPGGEGIARIGPASEAVVIWTVGMGILMGVILWIGKRA